MMKGSSVKELEEQVIVASYRARQVEEEMIVAKHKAGKLEEQVSELKSALQDFENKHERLLDLFDSFSARMCRMMTDFCQRLPHGEMQIFVKHLHGATRTIYVDRSDKIYMLKMKIEGIEGIPSDQHKFIYGGRKLEDEKTLADYNIQDESTVLLDLIIRVC